MKVQLNEWEQGMDFSLIPETVEEVAQLLRIAKNVKAQKPTVRFNFRKEPNLYVFMEKIKQSVQENCISNSTH